MARLLLSSKLQTANSRDESIISFKTVTLAAVVAAVTALSVPSGTALAALVTRTFEFSSTSGPLLFGPKIGSFTYDDSVVPSGGGFVVATGLFLDLDVSFGSWTFDESNANSGWLVFDAQGGLLDALFGNNCFAGGCQITSGSDHWWIRVGEPGSSANEFAYSGYNGATGFYSTSNNRLVPLSVPEPVVLALVDLGFAGLVAARSRRK